MPTCQMHGQLAESELILPMSRVTHLSSDLFPSTSSALAKRLAEKSVSEMTYFVSSGNDEP